MTYMMDTKLVCKKHPYNNPQQGVCSSCLAEKLSNLSTPCHNSYPSNSFSTKSTQVSAANYDSSNYSSSGDVSPRVGYQSQTRRHARAGSDSTGHVASGGGGGLKKSRSMIAYASRKSRDAVVAGGRSGKMILKKKGGFWAKLIRSTSKRTRDVFTHSRSTSCQQRFDLSNVN